MSMMRASGAMPSMTPLQIATASLAVPKSVMKTIVARAPDLTGEAESPGEGDFEEAVLITARISSGRKNKRMREIINAPLRLNIFRASQCKARGWHSERSVLKGTRQRWLFAREHRGRGTNDLFDRSGADRGVARRPSNEGRRLRHIGGPHPRDSWGHPRRLCVRTIGAPRRGTYRQHHRFVCRRRDTGLDRAEVEKGIGIFFENKESHWRAA